MLPMQYQTYDRFLEAEVIDRTSTQEKAIFKLEDGRKFESHRFLPLGKGDRVCLQENQLLVLTTKDNSWIDITHAWETEFRLSLLDGTIPIIFKEIETKLELEQFYGLQMFHYRGGSGVGRTVPIIAKSAIWDLPSLLGFIEISSSMIANTARKRFLDYPYREESEFLWKSWDRDAARKYSNMICRISRFVIHPEIRGIGLARLFLDAALRYAADRWHFGGFRPRFMEITADMLRYYHFLNEPYKYVGETEGNEHRLEKDMNYLVRKALAEDGFKNLPQGGGGIMTLQRSYASKLYKFIKANNKALPEVINSLKYDPSSLDQETWEALHRLNRKPKPCYMAGISVEAREYVNTRARLLSFKTSECIPSSKVKTKKWQIKGLTVDGSAKISQSKDARNLQDSFGFVGSDVTSTILQPTNFVLKSGETTLICGASGAGKTLLLNAVSNLFGSSNDLHSENYSNAYTTVRYSGCVNKSAKVQSFQQLSADLTPLDMIGRVSLTEFLAVTACTGLAEPQLLVRPIKTLSSGQKYRLQIALSFLKKPEILIIDNFCEHLDRFTLIAVCKGIKYLVKRYNVALIVATAGYDRVQESLNPDQKILVRRGDRAVNKSQISTHAI